MALFIKQPDFENFTFDGTDDAGNKHDLFGRKKFGENLMEIINQHQDYELVIGLDAQWGEGKTVFIHQWKNFLTKENDFEHVAYYDAFAHDYHDEPLVPFIAEIYNLFDIYDDNDKELLKMFLSDVVKFFTSRILPIPNTIDAITNHLIKHKSLNEKFNDNIEKLREKSKNKTKPIVFIIDELDRCKPSYAIKLLEVIKHLFSVPGIVFVLVTNSTQLRESIKHEYGTGIDAALYLNKFINLWANLPKTAPNTNAFEQNESIKNDNKAYIDYCVEKMKLTKGHLGLFQLYILCNIYELSLREIEKCLTYISCFYKSVNPDDDFMILGFYYLIILKVKYTDIFSSIVKKEITVDKLRSSILPDWLEHEPNNIHDNLKTVIQICLANSRDAVLRMTGHNKKIGSRYNEINNLLTDLTNFDL